MTGRALTEEADCQLVGGMTLPFRFPLWRLVVTTALVCTAGHLRAESFGSTVSQARKDHYSLVPIVATRLITEDKLDEGLDQFVQAVPEEKLTAADCTVLGELFRNFDTEKSVKYYRRANELLPDEPATNLALAEILHRAGNYTEAGIRYEQSLAVDPKQPLTHAALAECLIRAGKHRAAVDHWLKADPEENSTGIGRGIFEVHGAPHPFRRRAELLKALNAGQPEKIEDLMALSAVWDVDWWKSEPNKPYLERDLETAKTLLAKNPERVAELTLYARTYLEEVNAEWLKKELEAGGWVLGDHGKMPTSTRVAERVMNLAVKHRLTNVPALLERFEDELRKRAFGEGANDLAAARMVIGMLNNGGSKYAPALKGINLSGWQMYHDPAMAADFLAIRLNQNQLKYKSFELRRAVTEFPQDPLVRIIEVFAAEDELETSREDLAAAIQAEFAQLSGRTGTVRDISLLKMLFGKLKAFLDMQVMEK